MIMFIFIDVFPQCPTELGKNEKEEDYEDIECHISDGIDMGCQENIVKGMISEEWCSERLHCTSAR